MLKKIGIVREEKQPVDKRTPIIPNDCKLLMERFPDLKIFIQPSEDRCFSNDEYTTAGVVVNENLLECDLILGLKEVPIPYLIPNKRYMFFSHTIKKQQHNLKLIQSILDKNIQLIDYEALVNEDGKRVVAFGYWAGIVGAYNAIWTTQKRYYKNEIPRMYKLKDYETARENLKNLKFNSLKFVITGTGRVAQGAAQILKDAGIIEVSAEDFLIQQYEYPVYTQLASEQIFEPKFKHIEYTREAFHSKPLNFKSQFEKYTKVAQVFINAIYWDNKAPKLFSLKTMKSEDFTIKVIADITCDIAPEASVPSTLKATTIEQPLFGFLPLRERMVEPFTKNAIDVMSISNLPSEIPREASSSFSHNMINIVLPDFFTENQSIIESATVTQKGNLTQKFLYLESYVYDDEYRAMKMG